LKTLLFLLLIHHFQGKAQSADCTFKPPALTINFGTGNVRDVNAGGTAAYQPVTSSCPTDGHYTYTSYTSDCFRSDWITLAEDHTPGDVSGNMMLVNASYRNGYFLSTPVNGLKAGTLYEFGIWMTNVCKLTDKCPFPLLPDITIRLHTPEGKVVAQLETGELIRRLSPQWTQYKMMFTAPTGNTDLILTMIDNVPGGCGNDFALDDITFRECIKVPPPAVTKRKTPVAGKTSSPKAVAKKQPATIKTSKKSDTTSVKPAAKKQAPVLKSVAKKQAPAMKPAGKQTVKTDTPVSNPIADLPNLTAPVIKQKPTVSLSLLPALAKRASTLFKQIETEAGDIKIDLYDNGEIDGDTVTIYHNNSLLVRKARLSQQPISFRIPIDAEHPHHELVMVAENLGSIPPNTSLMIVTAGTKRYEVYISSNEQRNAKVILDLKL
jgi:hypothetical protein